MIGNLATSAMGFVRQAATVDVFGTGKTDAWFAASIVPQMFYDLTLGAAVSAALIPVFTEILQREGPESLGKTVGAVLGFAWLALAVVAAILVIFARPFMGLLLIAYHTKLHSGTVDESVTVVRILLPSVVFLGTSDILLSALYSAGKFRAPAFATIFYHAGIVAGAWFLARPLGLVALPVGALTGAGVQALVQVPALLRTGIRPRIHMGLTPPIRQILRLYLPVSAGLIISIVGQVLDLNFKASVGPHVISWMAAGTTLTQFPIGITVAALTFAILPSISSDIAFARLDEFKSTLALGVRMVLFLTIPATIGLLTAGTPIVRLVFERGDFSATDTVHTVRALSGYCLQIPFVGVDQLMIVAFYARRNTVTPMLIGVVGVGTYVVSALLLIPTLHIFGLALANTLQNSLHALILLVLMLALIGPFGGREVFTSIARSAGAGLAMGGAILITSNLAEEWLGTTSNGARIETVGLILTVAVVVYLSATALMRSQELSFLRGLLAARAAPGAG